MSRTRAAALLDRNGAVPLTVERSLTHVDQTSVGAAVVQAEELFTRLIAARYYSHPAAVGLIKRIMVFQSSAIAALAQRALGTVPKTEKRFEALVLDVERGLGDVLRSGLREEMDRLEPWQQDERTAMIDAAALLDALVQSQRETGQAWALLEVLRGENAELPLLRAELARLHEVLVGRAELLADERAEALRSAQVEIQDLRTEVELLGHAATTAQEEGLADQRALRAAQQQLVQVRAAHERDLAAQEARLGRAAQQRAEVLARDEERVAFDRRALLGRERTWNAQRQQLEADKKAAQDLVGSLNAELERKDQELAALRAELETLRAAPRPLEVTVLPDSPTAPLSAEQPTVADALSLRAFLVGQGLQASFEIRTDVKTVTADAPITPALLTAWAEAYPDAQARRAHVAAAMRKGRAA